MGRASSFSFLYCLSHAGYIYLYTRDIPRGLANVTSSGDSVLSLDVMISRQCITGDGDIKILRKDDGALTYKAWNPE